MCIRDRAYNASKAAVVALSETLYAELDPYGVKVSVLCPAFFKTNLTDTMRSTNKSGTAIAGKLMDKSTVTADDIAQQVYEDSSKGKLMILTHRNEKILWWVKRLLPSLYFKIMKKTAEKFHAKLTEKPA